MTPDLITQAATELAARRTTARTGDRLPEALRPTTLDDAWKIQREVVRLSGRATGGWKASLPGPGKLVVASIDAVDISSDAGAPATVRLPAICAAHSTTTANIEPEICFVLAQDLPPRDAPYTEAEVDAAIGRVHAALEICTNRYHEGTDIGFPEKLADGVTNAGLWLGPVLEAADQPAFELQWRAGDAAATTLAARHPDGHPRAPLYWLANYLREQGIGLQAGQVVTTGSYAGLVTVPIGQTLRFDYAGLAHYEVTLTL